jgi:hypothetical protein
MGAKGIRARALALIAAVPLLALSLSAGVVLADGGHHGDGDQQGDGGQHQGTAHNTFTKWVTALPLLPGDVADMAGVVGGDVGQGTFAGIVLRKVPSTTTLIEAIYHFNGSHHSFTALVHVEQTGLNAVILGVVTDGWLKGNVVNGKYTQTTCAQSPAADHTCFVGTLDIAGGSDSED